jgi:hypothetical protein
MVNECQNSNGVCWAGPFATIAILPSLLPYLVLVGIGLGYLHLPSA